MKQILLLLAAFIAVSANAQNADALQKRLEKNNAAIADAKKGSAPGTWFDRASIYYDIANAPTSKLIQGLTMVQASANIGKPLSTEPTTIAGIEYVKNDFAEVIVYSTAKDGVIQFWVAKKGDELDTFNKSIESLAKMKQISEKDFNGKGAILSKSISDQLTNDGRTQYSLGNPSKAAQYFESAVKSSELRGVVDTTTIYFAGLAYVEAKEWSKAIVPLDKVLAYGFNEGGNINIAVASCYENLDQPEKAMKILEESFSAFPNNSNVMGSLINIYLKNKIDPQKLIPIIHKAQSLDTKNASLYMVEGSVWDMLKDTEKAEEAFGKSIELDPENFKTYFNLALIRAQQGDALVLKARDTDINDNATYNKLIDQSAAIFSKSIDAFEKAHALNPDDQNTIEMLKSLYYQRRDKSDENNKKYEHYEQLLKTKVTAE